MENFNDEPWFKDYLLAVRSLLNINIPVKNNKLDLDKNTLIFITKNLIWKIKFLSESLKKVSCSNTTPRSRNEKLQPSEQLFELFSLCERVQEKEEGKNETTDEMDIVGLLIMTFKITIMILDKYFYNQDSNPELAEICIEFICTSLSVIKSFDPYANLQKGKEAIKHLALIILIAPDARIHVMLNNILPFILESIDSCLIKVFFTILMSYQKTVLVIIAEVLKRFSNIQFMEVLSKGPPKKVNMLLSLLGDVLKSICRFHLNITMLHKISLEKVTRNCILLLPESENPRNLLCVLKSIFLILQNDDLIPLRIHLEDCIPVLFRAFDLWFLTPVKADTFSLVLEFFFVCFSSFSSDSCRLLLPYVKTFIKSVIYAVNENSELAGQALFIFESFMADVGFCYISSFVSSLREDFLTALYKALESPVTKVNKSAFRILGKMGGHNRNIFKKAPKLEEADHYDLILKFKEGSIIFPTAKVIDAVYRNLCSEVDILRKHHAFVVLKMLLSSYVKLSELHSLDLTSKFSNSSRFSPNIFEVMNDVPLSQFSNAHKKILMAMFVAVEVPDFSGEMTSLVEQVTKVFICKANNQDLDFQLLIDAAVDIMCLPKDDVHKVNINALKIILDTALEYVGHENVCHSSFFKHIHQRVIYLCYQPTWEAKVVGCKGVQLFSKRNEDWIIDHIAVVLKPLTHAIVDMQGKISFGSISVIKNIVNEIFHHFITLKSKSNDIKEGSRINKVTEELFQHMIQGVMSDNYMMRYLMKSFFQVTKESSLAIPCNLFCELYNMNSLTYIFEDFDFYLAHRSLFNIFDLEKVEDLYDDLKNICNFEVFINGENTYSSRPRAIKRCCGALNALILNFFCKKNSERFFLLEICMDALGSPFKEISEAGFKCLSYVIQEYLPDVKSWIVEHIKTFFSNDEKIMHLLARSVDCYLRLDDGLISLLENKLMKFFARWKISITSNREWDSSFFSSTLDAGAQIINSLSILGKLDDSHIEEVISLLCEPKLVENCCFVYSTSSLTESLVEFCKRFPSQTTKIIISMIQTSNINAPVFFKELLKGSYIEVFIKEEEIIHLPDCEKLLKLLHYITEYNALWFANKHLLANKLSELIYKLCIEEKVEIIAKCLFHYCIHTQTHKIDILFSLIEVFVYPFSYKFQYIKDFLLNEVSKKYEIKWKALAFMKFHSELIKEEHVCKSDYFILKYIVVPSFNETFKCEKGPVLLNASICKNCKYVDYNGSIEFDEQAVNMNSVNNDCGESTEHDKRDVSDVQRESKDQDHQQTYCTHECGKTSVFDLYFECLKDICCFRHSEKVNLLFIKFSVGLCVKAQNKIASDNIFSNFIKKSKELVKKKNLIESEENQDQRIIIELLLLVLNTEETDGENSIATLSNLLSYSLYSEYAVCIAVTTMPIPVLSECFKKIIDSNFDMKSIINLVLMDYSNFQKLYSVHPFMEEIMKLIKVCDTQIFTMQCLQCKLAVDLIEAYVEWDKTCQLNHDKNLAKAEWNKTIINCLFKIPSLIHPNSLEKKCVLLLENIYKSESINKRYSVEFDNWIEDLLKKISEEHYENYKIFELMTKFVGLLPISTVKSFVKVIQSFLRSLLDVGSNHKMLLENICDYLKCLCARFPPQDYECDSEFDPFYKEIRILCTENGGIYKKSRVMLLQAVDSFFPPSFHKISESLIEYFAIVFQSHPQFADGTVTLVNLTLKNMTEIFIDLRYIVKKVCHTEILLKIIEIINLSTKCLTGKNASGVYEFSETSKIIFQEISNLVLETFEKISNTPHFFNNKEISIRLFQIVIKLRTYNSTYLRIDDDSLDIVFYIFGMFSKHRENYQEFFCCIAKELQHNLFSSFIFIFEKLLSEEKFLFEDSFSVKECINLISVLIESSSVFFATKSIEVPSDMSKVFFSILELCYADEVLSKSIWIEIFPQIFLSLLKENEQKVLSNKMKPFLEAITSEIRYSSLERNEAFIIAALKCDIGLSFCIHSKFINTSLDFQMHFCWLLEKFIFTEKFSSVEICSKIIPKLNEMTFGYIFLEENFLLHYFYENFDMYAERLKSASCIQEDNISKSFYINQFIRNALHLTRWTDELEKENDIHQFSADKMLSKWDIENLYHLPPEISMLNYNLWKEKPNVVKEEISTVINHCIKTFKFLPKTFLSRCHYSLLELIEFLTEIEEAWTLININPNSNPNNISVFFKMLNNTCYEWHQRPYLLSDDSPFLIRLYHFREIFLQNVQKNISLSKFSNFVTISNHLVHEINDCRIKPFFIAVKHQNVYLEDLRFQKISTENDFCLREVKLLQLLRQVKSSLNDKEKKSILDSLKKLILTHLGFKKHRALCSYGLQIAHELNRYEIFLQNCLSKDPFNIKGLEIMAEIHEDNFHKNSDVKHAELALIYLLQACKYGSTSVCLKLLPKVFLLLEHEDENCSIAKASSEEYYYINRSNWVPFLPTVISLLNYSLRKYQKKLEEDEPVKCLSDILISILLDVAIIYPQPVFFSLECLKLCEGKRNHHGKITDKLFFMHPNMISKLEETVKIIGDEPNIHTYKYLCTYKKLLEKAYCSVFQNLRRKEDIFDSKLIISSFKSTLANESFREALGSHEIISSAWLESLQCYTSEKIIDLLRKSVSLFSDLCAKDKNEARDKTNEKLQKLSNYLFESDVNICLFGQSTLNVDCSSHVKIYKVCPEVETLDWNNDKVYKVNLLGYDGKMYSYVMFKDFFCKKETMETMKITQLLEILNPLLDENLNCSTRFLNFDFLRLTPMGPHYTFVPYNNLIPYHDIYRMHSGKHFSEHMYFSQLFDAYGSYISEENFMKLFFDSIQVPGDILVDYIETLFPSPLEFFSFKNQFLKHISMLIVSTIFFNISTKQLLISRSTGIVNAQHLEFSLDNKADIEYITPNVRTFIGQLGIKIVTKNIMAVAEFLKDHKEIDCLICLMKKESIQRAREENKKIKEFITKNLDCIKTSKEIQDLLLSSSESTFLSHLNPLGIPWF